MKYLLVTIGIFIILWVVPQVTSAETAVQDVQVEQSGGLILKSQRQQKNNNTYQSAVVKQSGGLIIIIQRNINKFKGGDLKTVTDLIPSKAE